ncbi:hypothetical protein NP233_g5898 [Leucocoprinus birnbaumii]|uniref:Uncharacterized protein n=1 Tax=Leucocoprinus birnbaumii TaxID=56174 RepID=A0AAD5VT96_9AGAR|nr:hypothetical protein NP233_g5898 [Leucocoprinus birnbaumii]
MSESPKKKKKAKTRMCTCRICHFWSTPIPLKTWRQHQALMKEEQEALARHRAKWSLDSELTMAPDSTEIGDVGTSSGSDQGIAGGSTEPHDDNTLEPVRQPTPDNDVVFRDPSPPGFVPSPTSGGETAGLPPQPTPPAEDINLPPQLENDTTATNAAGPGNSQAQVPPSGPDDLDEFLNDAEPETRINITRSDKVMTDKFIRMLEDARLDDSNLSLDDIIRLRNPSTTTPRITTDLSEKYSLKYYLDTMSSADLSYVNVIATSNELQEEQKTGLKFLSHYEVQKKARELSGVVTVHSLNTRIVQRAQPHDGTSANSGAALYSSPESAQKMHYQRNTTCAVKEQWPPDPQDPNGPPSPKIFEDYIHGSDYLGSVHNGEIKENDILLMLSLDGAQFPDHRYKKTHVLPGGFIPGPNKPKNIDSFLFPGLYHLSALQNEGLKIWDASTNAAYIARPVVYFATADAPGIVYLCGVKWRHKPTGSHYYPVLHLPNGYHSNHTEPFADIDLNVMDPYFDQENYYDNLRRVLESSNDFEAIRKETGISKASLFSGLKGLPLGVPGTFPLDLMHLLALNIPDLLISLWRGTLRCDTKAGDKFSDWAEWAVLRDTKDQKTWTIHGARVAELSKYLPSSYDRPPRNPAEKLNSGYKASEFMVYLYGYLPALLEGILPSPYLNNSYKLVQGVRLVSQRAPTERDLKEAHQCSIQFLNGFEELYVQQKISRMHFVCQCLHTLWHLAPETNRLGPAGIYAQWTMEHLIGLLSHELCLHSNPYANLMEIGIEHCVVNALFCKYPTFDRSDSSLPHTACPLKDGYVLLHPHERKPFQISQTKEHEAYLQYLQIYGFNPDETTCTRHA